MRKAILLSSKSARDKCSSNHFFFSDTSDSNCLYVKLSPFVRSITATFLLSVVACFLASTNSGSEGIDVITGGLDVPRPRSRVAVTTGAVITTAAAAISRDVECLQLKRLAGVRVLAVVARDMLCIIGQQRERHSMNQLNC